MKLRVLFSFLLLYGVTVISQVVPKLDSLKISVVANAIEGEYYLCQSDMSKKPQGFEVIQKLSNQQYIVKTIRPNLTRNQDIKLYQLPKDWKLSPTLKTRYPKLKNKKTVVKVNLRLLDQHKNNKSLYQKVHYSKNKYVVADVTPRQLEVLMQHENIGFIGLSETPTTEALVSSSDFSVNAISNAHLLYPDITGENSTVSIKELLFDTSDIDYAPRVRLFGNESTSRDQHATAMATLVGGIGNSGPTGKGVAQKGNLSSSSFLQLFPDDSEQFINNSIYTQNHSYGVSVENFYGNEAAAYDEQVFAIPDLIHVFSAGNSGLESAEDGPYAGIENFATLTGNFKQAKNVLTVGATNALDIVDDRSSKGPAFDGRLKPDFVAYAPGGTSDAAALVSGTVALVQDLYFKKNGQMPLFPLVKSALISGSEDVGATHIDFKSGYGKLNALHSLAVVDANQFKEGFISERETINHSIVIPENTKSLKVALSWLDSQSTPGSVALLNNNLNLSLLTPTGTSYNPWVLNSMPTANALKEPAVRGLDAINTSELITIENPISGEYVITVVSDSQNTNQVPYAISYFMENVGIFEWRYPLENERLNNAVFPVIRWKNTTELTSGTLFYRINGGPWILVAENIDLASEKYLWELPQISGNVELQVTSGLESFNSNVFQISAQPQVNVSFNCDDTVGLLWDPIPDASGYLVKSIIDDSLQTLATVTVASFTNKKAENSSPYFSITPLFGTSEGIASNTININDSGVSCYYRGFFALLTDTDDVALTLELSTALDIMQVQFIKAIHSEEIVVNTVNPPFNSLNISIMDTFLRSGNNKYSVKIFLEDGSIIETNLVDIFIPEENELILYPNPVPNGFSLNFISKGVIFRILDFKGRVIIEDNVLGFEDFIGVNLSQGVYLFQLLDGNKKQLSAKQFIVK